MITITVNADAVVLALDAHARGVPVATVRAQNRAIKSGRTFMVREMSRDTGLKSKDVRDVIVLREASANRPVASISAPLKRLPLIKFNARGPEPSRGRGRGVSYRLGTSGRSVVPHGFIATMPTGHRGVFVRKRTGKGTNRPRPAIRELFGPSLGKVFNKFREPGLVKVREAFAQNFDHELAYAAGVPGAAAPVDSEQFGTD